MKILHTSDWHIGKIVNNTYMTADQNYILKQLLAVIKTEKPDVVIIAGDLYDRGVPPVEAVELLDRIFNEILLNFHVPILAVAGNHDSPDRLAFGSKILQSQGLHIEGRLKADICKVVLTDEFGPVNFYLVPYAHPAAVRDVLGDDTIHNHEDAMKAIINKIKQQMNCQERNVLITHGYIIGEQPVELSESERPLSIGGTDIVSAEYMNDFSYIALGHLHGPQKVNSRARYAGSLLKYSFSEVRQKKSVTMVTMDATDSISIELKAMTPWRDMRRIKGELHRLLDPAVYEGENTADFLHVTLTDEGELIDPMNKLRAVYPNVLELERTDKNITGEVTTAAGEGYRKKSKLELFADFYKGITGQEFTEEKAEIIAKAIEKAEQEEAKI